MISRRGPLAVTMAILVVLFCLPARAAAEEPTTWTFEYHGGEPQTFVVPEGVTKLSMMAIGGAGAPASDFYLGAPGGASGATYGRFDVTPGEVLTVWVGGEGLAKTGSEGISTGYGCGGPAGHGHGPLVGHASADGGGGGAASAVARGDFGEEEECAEGNAELEANLLVVAGGGGGGGEGSWYFNSDGKGGVGGDGGNPPGGEKDSKGCGGCRPGPDGQGGEDAILLNGGGGGGGGGYRGGGGGGSGPEGAVGGGGGSSYVGPGALASAYLPGHGTGGGSVVLTALESEAFTCTGRSATATIPEGVNLMEVEATGGAGDGAVESQSTVLGGKAGTASGTFEVDPGESYEVSVGCQGGTRDGGWGYGTGGEGGGRSLSAEDGHGGGGSSAVVRPGSGALLVAGGGGGSGGRGGPEYNGAVSGVEGGTGGAGGDPAEKGGSGEHGVGGGGEGGAVASQTGASGGTAHDLTEGGGGGGGGAGWLSGAGGGGGPYVFNSGGGGGGGGGGLSHVAEGARNASVGTGELVGGGLVKLSFLRTGPALIGAYGGSGQSIEVGGEFAAPLEARVVDVAANPVAGAAVTFTLPATGAAGTFAGGGTSAVATTDEEGIATSPSLTANGIGGGWEATAAVAPVASPATFALVNTGSPTTVTVTPSDDPTTPTEPVTFTADVHALNPIAGTPTGTVQFYEGESAIGEPVELSGGSATSPPRTGLAVGTHMIEARYEGAASYRPGVGQGSVLVERTGTVITVSSSRNPALAGETVTFTATVSVPANSSPYEGEVLFMVGGVALGAPVQASGGTAVSPPYEVTSGGSLLVEAISAGSTDFEPSQGEMIQSTDPNGVAVELGSSANPVEYGSPFELRAEVVPVPAHSMVPQGTVEFEGNGQRCQGTLAEGRTGCSLASPLEPGSHEIKAAYGGDSSYDPGAGGMIEQVVKARTSTAVTATPGTVRYGEEVKLAAEVGRRTAGEGTPSGTVGFALDGASLGSPQTLANGRAESAPTTPVAGIHLISARYGGDARFKRGEGLAPYLVLPDPTHVSLTASDASSQPGAGVTFTATVAAPPPAGGAAAPTPTGKVQFRVDGLDLGSPVALQSGSAVSVPDSGLAPGNHRVAALFLPADGNFLPAAATHTHVVEQPTSTVVASAANPSPAGAPVTLRAHVGPTGAGGRLSFAVDGAPVPACQELPVAENEASCVVKGLGSGDHGVSASFSGSPLLDPSRGAVTQTVEAEPTSDAASPSPPAAATPAVPTPAACALRTVRARMLVFRHRPAIRLVARYLADAPATRVTVDFFDRHGNGGWGKKLGTIEQAWTKRGTARLDLRLPARAMDRLRRGNGFGARFTVAGDPGFCAEQFDRDLSLRRKVEGQPVWFQSGSNPAALP